MQSCQPIQPFWISQSITTPARTKQKQYASHPIFAADDGKNNGDGQSVRQSAAEKTIQTKEQEQTKPINEEQVKVEEIDSPKIKEIAKNKKKKRLALKKKKMSATSN